MADDGTHALVAQVATISLNDRTETVGAAESQGPGESSYQRFALFGNEGVNLLLCRRKRRRDI